MSSYSDFLFTLTHKMSDGLLVSFLCSHLPNSRFFSVSLNYEANFLLFLQVKNERFLTVLQSFRVRQ